LALDFDIDDCDLVDFVSEVTVKHCLMNLLLQKFLSIVLALGTVGLAMVSALAGYDYGDVYNWY
jgi:hypothetical protein